MTCLAVAAGIGAWAAAVRSQAPRRESPAPRHTNRLIHETSPYLLQHAHNPVDWYPWGPEALRKARTEHKPIFLSIGYSSCHWCHVMERESFEDEGVAAFLNAHFVAIKVDREERPDLDEIYMTAVQMMTGSGGWPMSVFLTPDGKPFYGGTYFPRDPFLELLRKVNAAWEDPAQRPGLEQAAARIGSAIGQESAATAAAGTLAPSLPRAAVKQFLAELDPVDGGFGGAPKFPPSQRLALMLAEYRKRPDPHLLHAVTLTLDRMARGGIYDQVGGGFHRYSTDRPWLVPHFEKMLYDNALLAWVYLDAFELTRRPLYRRVGTETLDFALRELRDPQGGFRSTLDADSGGGEGRFYLWTPRQVAAVLGPRDGRLFCRIYDITERGNFEGRSIPNLLHRPVDAWSGRGEPRVRPGRSQGSPLQTPAALQKRLDGMRATLRAARDRREHPRLDDKVLTNWNGLMLRALARGYEVTGAERYRDAAVVAASFLLTTCRAEGSLRHAYRAGRTQPQAFLEDYSFLAAGLLDLYRATGDDRWLKAAHDLARTLVAEFWDDKTGTLYSTPRGHEQLLARLANAEDGATPSGQSMAALALVRLGRLTGDADLRARAQRLLTAHVTAMKRFPQAMPTMLLAAYQFFTPEESGGPASAPRRVAAELIGVPTRVRPGELIPLRLRLTIAPGWHLSLLSGSRLPAPSSLRKQAVLQPRAESREPRAALEVTAAPGPFSVARVLYPAAERVRLGFASEPLPVLRGTVVIRLWLRTGVEAGRATAVRLRLRYQACSESVCEQPVTMRINAPIRAQMQEETRAPMGQLR